MVRTTTTTTTATTTKTTQEIYIVFVHEYGAICFK